MVSEDARALYERIVKLPEPERRRIYVASSNEMKAGLWTAQLENFLATEDVTPEQRAFIERWIEQISAPDWFALDARDPGRAEELEAFRREVLALFPREVAGPLFQHLGPPECGLPTSRRPPGTPE
jgi:hypothetical protein